MSPTKQDDPAAKEARRAFIDALGRDRVQRRLGVTPSAITNAIHRGLPAGWLPVLSTLCAEDGRDVPLALFNVRPASGEDAA